MVLSSNSQSMELDLSKGGSISQLTLFSNGRSRKVISPKKGYHYESSLLFPFPNRLSEGKFTFEKKDYQFPLNDFGQPNALHGFMSDKPFQVLSQQGDSLSLHYSYAGDLSYYPFPFDFKTAYTLKPGELVVDITVKNTGDSAIPCGFGWHPYFNIEDDTEIELKDVVKICVDDNQIPTGRSTPYKTMEDRCRVDHLKLDTCFEFLQSDPINTTKLFFSDDAVLEIWQDEHHPYVQIFTPDDGQTMAIEPMTCSINALGTGVGTKVLETKEAWSFQFGVSLR